MKISIFHKKIPELMNTRVTTMAELGEQLGGRLRLRKDEVREAVKEMQDLGLLERKGKHLIYFRE